MLENIILCTGTAFQRKDMLINTYRNDCRFLSFKKIFLSTCDPEMICSQIEGQPIFYEQFAHINHQLDCANCIISSIRNAVNNLEVLDNDIILFKHESYFIKDIYLFKQAVEKIFFNDYNLVIQAFRKWLHTGVFLIKASAAKNLFHCLKNLNHFPHNTSFCEGYLTKHVFNRLKKIYALNSEPQDGTDNRLGLYHFPPGGPKKIYWDMRDYHDLYKKAPRFFGKWS